ncbi:MAG TPA: hypothetical protein VLN56_06295 [Gammaproteobacteria bacterium]|nr:hypothetical protein [Gammaproteobacteria bacterium]
MEEPVLSPAKEILNGVKEAKGTSASPPADFRNDRRDLIKGMDFLVLNSTSAH